MAQRAPHVNTEKLRKAGLRPTRQRLALASLLFAHGDRHVTAEGLHEEAVSAGVPVSLATVYNTMHQFTAAGLLREVTVDGTRTYFDTNTGDHHHFYCEDDGMLMDIDGTADRGRGSSGPAPRRQGRPGGCDRASEAPLKNTFFRIVLNC